MNIALLLSILWVLCSFIAAYKAKNEKEVDNRMISYALLVVFVCISQFFLGISLIIYGINQ